MERTPRGHPRKDSTLACSFCNSNVDNEEEYGPMYTMGSVTCHYFCVLLCSKLVQNGDEKHGILGFLYNDIVKELQWAKRKRCHYCNLYGATIFCCQSSCRTLFHLPCGKQNGALTLFHKSYQSFCMKHRKNQVVPTYILNKRKVLVVKLKRLSLGDIAKLKADKKYRDKFNSNLRKTITRKKTTVEEEENSFVDKCNICLETILPYPLVDTFWPPCCKGDEWFHRKCLQKLALSAGEHYIRCPLCNNKDIFMKSLLEFGIYIPSRDASWERERGAFSELLERPNSCNMEVCLCPMGRSYKKSKKWAIVVCDCCGSEAVHEKCAGITKNFECNQCIAIIKPKINDSAVNISADVSVEDIIDVDSCDDEEQVNSIKNEYFTVNEIKPKIEQLSKSMINSSSNFTAKCLPEMENTSSKFENTVGNVLLHSKKTVLANSYENGIDQNIQNEPTSFVHNLSDMLAQSNNRKMIPFESFVKVWNADLNKSNSTNEQRNASIIRLKSENNSNDINNKNCEDGVTAQDTKDPKTGVKENVDNLQISKRNEKILKSTFIRNSQINIKYCIEKYFKKDIFENSVAYKENLSNCTSLSGILKNNIGSRLSLHISYYRNNNSKSSSSPHRKLTIKRTKCKINHHDISKYFLPKS